MAKKDRPENEGRWGPETLNQKLLETLHRAGVRPEIIYAFQKTGRIVTEENFHKFSQADLKAWTDAVDQWRAEHRSNPEPSVIPLRRDYGLTASSNDGQYRVWLSKPLSEDVLRRLLRLAGSLEAAPLRISMDVHTPTFTFITTGNLRADINVIDAILEEASR